MRLIIRSMALAFIFAFAIQPSAKAEVVSNTYWQSLPVALQMQQAINIQRFLAVVHWNEVVAWNQAIAAQEEIPKTKPQPKVESDYASSGDKFDRLAQCESGGKASTNTGNGYYGAFQFTLSTWKAVGGAGLPSDHSYSEQKQKAMELASRAAPSTQWPVCWKKSGG